MLLMCIIGNPMCSVRLQHLTFNVVEVMLKLALTLIHHAMSSTSYNLKIALYFPRIFLPPRYEAK